MLRKYLRLRGFIIAPLSTEEPGKEPRLNLHYVPILASAPHLLILMWAVRTQATNLGARTLDQRLKIPHWNVYLSDSITLESSLISI